MYPTLTDWEQFVRAIYTIGTNMLSLVADIWNVLTTNLSNFFGINDLIDFFNNTVGDFFGIAIPYEELSILGFMVGGGLVLYIIVMLIKWLIGIIT